MSLEQELIVVKTYHFLERTDVGIARKEAQTTLGRLIVLFLKEFFFFWEDEGFVKTVSNLQWHQ